MKILSLGSAAALLLIHSPSANANPIQLGFTQTASSAVAGVIFPEVFSESDSAQDINCYARVFRPEGDTPALSSEENSLTCENANGRSASLSFGDGLIDRWGSRFLKKAFTLTGGPAQDLFQKMKIKGKSLPGITVLPTHWTQAVLCDPQGDECNEAYALSMDPHKLHAQMECYQITRKSSEKQLALSPDATRPESHGDYYLNWIQAGLDQGVREVYRTACIFME